MKKRLILFLTAVLLALSTLTTPINALKPTYSPTEAYKSSIFYERLIAIKLTGDQRRDILNVAISQLGYHEGNSKADFHGTNYSGSNNYVEYNYANRNTLDAGGSYYWCASFVTFCARQAGISTSIVINSVSCDNFVVSFKNKGRYKTRSSGYTPIAGDLIFFFDSGSNRTYSSHVGIVVGVSGGKVYTIEGNTTRDMVNRRSYDLNNSRIVGYGVPAYTGTTGNYNDFELKNGYVEPGIYKVSSDTLNLRSQPTTSSSIIKTVKKSTEFFISEASGDWGKSSYNGQTVWLLLNYVTPQDISDYSITYRVADKIAPKLTAKAGSTIKLAAPLEIPIGYEFLGWANNPDAETTEFSPGDYITVKKDTIFYAVLKAKPITVSFFDDNGRILSENVYKYGDKIEEPASPQKADDSEFEYIFVGWDKPFISTARANRSYTAIYHAIAKTTATTEASSTDTTVPEEVHESTFETSLESVTNVFSSDIIPTDKQDTPKEEKHVTPILTAANVVSIVILISVTVSLTFIKRKS